MPKENTYFAANYNTPCKSHGALDVDSFNECHYGGLKIYDLDKDITFQGDEHSKLWPSGCYLFGTTTYKIAWNNNTGEILNDWSRKICKKNGKKCNLFTHCL